jgi:hypothetical protein
MSFVCDDFYRKRINEEVNVHDLSKLSQEEFVPYRQTFYPADPDEKVGFVEAWEHHKKCNPHHWENWTKKVYGNPNEWKVHCVHMVLDWMAMGYYMNDTAQEYYEKNKDNIILPDYWKNFIYTIFERLNDGNNDSV